MTQAFSYLQTTFNTRELAVGIWLTPFIAFALTRKGVRSSLKILLDSIFKLKVIAVFGALVCYILSVVLAIKAIGAWDSSLTKIAILWSIFSATALTTSTLTAESTSHPLRAILIHNMRAMVILEFIVNSYTFSLPAELLLVPGLTALTLMIAIASNKQKYSEVKTMLTWIQTGIGLSLLITSATYAISNLGTFGTWKTLESFLLPPGLSIALIPFFYFWRLIMAYETTFSHLRLSSLANPKSIRKTKLLIIRSCGPVLRRIVRFEADFGAALASIDSPEELRQMIEKRTPKRRETERS